MKPGTMTVLAQLASYVSQVALRKSMHLSVMYMLYMHFSVHSIVSSQAQPSCTCSYDLFTDVQLTNVNVMACNT